MGGEMSDLPEGCVKTTAGPIVEESVATQQDFQQTKKEVSMPLAQVGKPAPDFELSAFHQGGFKNVKLSDYKGKWIVVCFYPGDFTFV
jgi:peroxiredoxin (alkyl hydroperoxide reductase subunit C)